jgi:hypothetical protein
VFTTSGKGGREQEEEEEEEEEFRPFGSHRHKNDSRSR